MFKYTCEEKRDLALEPISVLSFANNKDFRVDTYVLAYPTQTTSLSLKDDMARLELWALCMLPMARRIIMPLNQTISIDLRRME